MFWVGHTGGWNITWLLLQNLWLNQIILSETRNYRTTTRIENNRIIRIENVYIFFYRSRNRYKNISYLSMCHIIMWLFSPLENYLRFCWICLLSHYNRHYSMRQEILVLLFLLLSRLDLQHRFITSVITMETETSETFSFFPIHSSIKSSRCSHLST